MAQGVEVGQRARVLVIDDDEIALEAIREVLVGAGYEVKCLSSPIGATQVIVSQHMEAVVVDLNMPVMRGDKFISLLRSWDKIRDLPVVLISGSSKENLDALASGLGDVQTVTKDKMRQALPQALKHALAKDKASARRADDLSSEDKRALATAASGAAKSLTASDAGIDWQRLGPGVRALLAKAQAIGTPQLVKTVKKALEVAELCAVDKTLTPDARLALRGLFETLAGLEDGSTANNLPQLLGLHFSRLQRVAEEKAK